LEAVALYVAAIVRSVPARQGELVISAALRGMIAELGDPLAAIFLPVIFVRYMEELRGEHGGIGAQIDLLAGTIVIGDVTPGGPAAGAGLAAGDVLLEVNARATSGRTPDQVMDLLRGAPGTTVLLTVQRGSAMTRHTLTRAAARENPTRSMMIDTRIGYIRLLEFSEHSGRDVAAAVNRLRARGAAALILDLRQNLGGLVAESVEVASLFLPDGVVAMEERRGGLKPLDVRPADRFPGPVVVLVDRLTASAGEIVAGALQDHGAPLIGTRTFGKVTVQSISIPPLSGGWGIRVTTARYYTRRGRTIDGVGLVPNTMLQMSTDLIQSMRDGQLEEAAVQARQRLPVPSGP
ncbi:MAG: S41 family peptidase, partial [bacterium]